MSFVFDSQKVVPLPVSPTQAQKPQAEPIAPVETKRSAESYSQEELNRMSPNEREGIEFTKILHRADAWFTAFNQSWGFMWVPGMPPKMRYQPLTPVEQEAMDVLSGGRSNANANIHTEDSVQRKGQAALGFAAGATEESQLAWIAW